MMHARQLGVRGLSWITWGCFILTLCLTFPISPSADQAQYVYDELGRLIGVQDGQGNVATYEYDAVGNLLRISRSSGTTSPVIVTSAPSSMELGTTTPLVITGADLWPATVTVSNPDVLATVDVGSPTTLTILLTIPTVTTLGATTVTITTFGGVATTTIDIVDPLTTVSGRVLDPQGNPAADATIEVADTVLGVSAADGSFVFSGIGTVAGAIQVKATGLVEGVPVVGLSATVPPVFNGVTDVGHIQLPQPSGIRAVAINDVDFTLNVLNPLTLSIEASVPLPTTSPSRPVEVVVSGDGSTALVTVGHSTIHQKKLIFVDLTADPPAVLSSLTPPFSNTISEITLGCPRPDIAFVSGFGAGPADAISVDMASQTIISELTASISNRLVLLPPAGVHVLGRGGFSSLALASLDPEGRLFDTGMTLSTPGFGNAGLVVSPTGDIGLFPSEAGDEPFPTFVDVVDIDAGPTLTLRDQVVFSNPSFAGPHSITFNRDGTKVYLLIEAKDLGVLDVDVANNVTDSGLRVTDAGDGGFAPHAIAVLDGTQQVLVRKEGVVTVIDQSTHTISGTIALPGKGGIATVGMDCS